jgi:hypothetical protein
MLITEQDFDMLSNTQMQWNGYDWEIQADRFESHVTFDHLWAFWFDNRTALILARNFLVQREIKFQETYDEALEQYVILTDYAVTEYEVA